MSSTDPLPPPPRPGSPAPGPRTIAGQLAAVIRRRGLRAVAVATGSMVDPGSLSRFLSTNSGLSVRALGRILVVLDLRLSGPGAGPRRKVLPRRFRRKRRA